MLTHNIQAPNLQTQVSVYIGMHKLRGRVDWVVYLGLNGVRYNRAVARKYLSEVCVLYVAGFKIQEGPAAFFLGGPFERPPPRPQSGNPHACCRSLSRVRADNIEIEEVSISLHKFELKAQFHYCGNRDESILAPPAAYVRSRIIQPEPISLFALVNTLSGMGWPANALQCFSL